MKRSISFAVVFLLALFFGFNRPAAASDSDAVENAQKDERLLRPRHEVTVTASPIWKAVKDCSVSVGILDETDIL
ncbi:MAG: hypothetical protein PHX73_11215, partial [Acidobacteriota bacterium]|nr:hypothetical protein [Acidobacteriota bacterium]